MKYKAKIYSGLILTILSVILLINSLKFTGFIILEKINNKISFTLGVIFFIIGVVIFMSGARRRNFYNEIAGKIYNNLGHRGAYGHHTEAESVVESRVAGGRFSKRDVGEVIKEEIKNGRLTLDKSRTAISLPTNPARLNEITSRYGSRLDYHVRERIEILRGRKIPLGTR